MKGWRKASLGPMVALVVTWAIFACVTPETFLRWSVVLSMLRQTVVVALAAIGMTFVIISGGIDLSVGSAVALTTVVMASTLRGGSGPIAALLAGIASATAAGLVSGALIARLQIAPFIVTLAAMTVLRGAAKGLADEQKIDCDPQGLDALLAPSAHGLHVPLGVWVVVLVGVAAALTLRWTRFGRHVYAIGSNEATARLCGVNVSGVKIGAYVLAGALAGLAGVMEFSTLTVGDPTDSIGLELEVIAAVVIGGASLSGGEGTVFGSLAGALLMEVIRTGFTHVGVHNWVQEMATGGIILAAVVLDRVNQRRR